MTETPGFSRLKTAARWLWLPALLGFACYQFLVWNLLPGDEEMIAHFRAHRAEFEELVKRYREYERPANKDTSLWFKEGDTPELYKKASIQNISYANPVWLPSPYLLETAKLVERRRKELAPLELSHKFGSLMLKPEAKDRYYSFHPLRLDIWKDFYFIPQVPRIENGELLWPVDTAGEYLKRRRVFSSLNKLPVFWKRFECVYRQIEPQWFIRMCNGS